MKPDPEKVKLLAKRQKILRDALSEIGHWFSLEIQTMLYVPRRMDFDDEQARAHETIDKLVADLKATEPDN